MMVRPILRAKKNQEFLRKPVSISIFSTTFFLFHIFSERQCPFSNGNALNNGLNTANNALNGGLNTANTAVNAGLNTANNAINAALNTANLGIGVIDPRTGNRK